ncbi:hypothetical protein JZ751_016160, partial [Albula glossodonta]
MLAVVSYITCCRALCCCVPRKRTLRWYFFHQRNHLDVTAGGDQGGVPADGHHPRRAPPALHAEGLPALTRGQYPVFNKYPAFIVEHQSRERERIRQQEVEYLRERQTVQEMQAEAVRRQAADQAWYTQQELLQEAEEQRRKILLEEERKLTDQRARRCSETRDSDRHAGPGAASDGAGGTERLFEQQLAKEQARVTQEVKAEVEVRKHRAELEDSAFQQLLDTDTALNMSKKLLEESMAEAEQLSSDADWKAEVLRRLEQAGAEQDRHHQELALLTRDMLAKEELLVHTLREVEGKK